MNPITIAMLKIAADSAVSMSTGFVITNAIKATTPPTVKLLPRAGAVIGAAVLSSMVGDAATKYVHEKIDEVRGQVNEVKDSVKEAKEAKDDEDNKE